MIIYFIKTSTLSVIALLLLILSAQAQDQPKSFIGAGISLTHSSNEVPDGNTYPGLYAEAGLRLPARLQARFLFTADNEAQLPTIYRRDKGLRTPKAELNFRQELRFFLPELKLFKPFVSGGVDLNKQFFDPIEHSYKSHPEFGMNALATVGVQLNGSEASYTYIFPDHSVFNKSKLKGHRANYAYVHRLNARLALKFAGEADLVSFREHDGSYGDYYREKDVIFKGRIGFILHSKEK